MVKERPSHNKPGQQGLYSSCQPAAVMWAHQHLCYKIGCIVHWVKYLMLFCSLRAYIEMWYFCNKRVHL